MNNALRNIALGMITVCCAVIVAMLSFISLPLSVAVFAVGSLLYIITSEHKRRLGWEAAADFKFQLINKKHDALAGTVKDKFEANKIEKPAARRKIQADQKVQARKKKAANSNAESVSFHSLIKATPEAANETGARQILSRRVPIKNTAHLPIAEITQKKAQSVSVIEDAESLSDLVVEELTTHALKNNQIDIFMQPVLRLPQQQRKFYEVFSRVRAKSGVYIPAKRFMGVARKNGQAQDIDGILLEQCLSVIKNSASQANAPSFFINIDAKTLRSSHFVNRLLPFLAKNRSLAGRLVFEMKQAEFHDLGLPAMKIMKGLAQLGCAFSLDHVTSLDEDVADLQRFRVRFLKANARMFADAVGDERRYKAIMKSKRTLEGNGIGLIAEKIEDAEMMRKLLDYDLHYGQGYHFGRPDLQGAYEPFLKKASNA